jgi:hypothetical protein
MVRAADYNSGPCRVNCADRPVVARTTIKATSSCSSVAQDQRHAWTGDLPGLVPNALLFATSAYVRHMVTAAKEFGQQLADHCLYGLRIHALATYELIDSAVRFDEEIAGPADCRRR